VILVDVNILVYATFKNFSQHEPAREWLDEQLGGAAKVGLPWPSLLGFLRLATNPRQFPRPLRSTEGWQQVTSWLSARPAWIPQPTDRHAEVLAALLADPGVHGNLVPDAHLAALAIEHGLTMCSADGDLARFKGLRWTNPLSA
jgi:hypothetical protein